jgi:hypothetical protein
MKQKLMAFWKYDLFPYFLSGEIAKIHDDGFVEPTAYGGMRFRLLKVLPFEVGQSLKDKIDKIVVEDQRSRDELRKNSLRRIADLMGNEPKEDSNA